MHRQAVAIGIALAACAASIAATTQPPNLAGHWVQDSPAKDVAGVGPTCGDECVIRQDGKTLTVTEVTLGAKPYVSVSFDGSPTTTVLRFGSYSAERTLTAQWEGATLAITTKTNGSVWGMSRLTLQDGRLVISATGKGRGGDGTKFIYRRAK